MRHRQRGRTLGRSPSHKKAMLRNLACSLILTERDEMFYEGLYQPDGKTAVKPPRKKGRIVTTLHKAKEVRPLLEKCVTIAKKAIPHEQAAEEFAVDAERNSDAWRQWRSSDQWHKWNAAMAPAVAARRRAFQLLRDKEAVSILFDEIAPRYVERPGGFTRILRLAKPRLGDAGIRAILEFVGEHDRIKKQEAAKPAFDDEVTDELETEQVQPEAESVEETQAGDDDADQQTTAEATDTDEASPSEDESKKDS